MRFTLHICTYIDPRRAGCRPYYSRIMNLLALSLIPLIATYCSSSIKSACNTAQVTAAGALLLDGSEPRYSDAVAVSCAPALPIVARRSCIVAAYTGITIAGSCREPGFRDGPRLYSRFQNIAVFASYTRGDTMFAATDASGMLRLGNELNVASLPTDATISALAVGVSQALEMVVFSIDEQGRGSIVLSQASTLAVFPYGCSICAWSGRYFYVLDVGGSVSIVRPNGDIDARVFTPPLLQGSAGIVALIVKTLAGVWGIDGDGWHRFLFNDDACTRCPPGMYANNRQCAPCPVGSVAPVEGAVACMSCDVGQFSNIEGTACLSADAANSGENNTAPTAVAVFTVGRLPQWMCAPAAIVGSSNNNTIWVACASGDVVVVVGNSTSRLTGALPFSDGMRCSIAITRDDSVVVVHCGETMARITSLSHVTRWGSGGIGDMCIATMNNSQNEAEDTIFWTRAGDLMHVPALYADAAPSRVDGPAYIFAFLPHPSSGMFVLGYQSSTNRTVVFRLHANFVVATTMVDTNLRQTAACCWDDAYVDAAGHVLQTPTTTLAGDGHAGHIDDVGTMARLTAPLILAKRVITDKTTGSRLLLFLEPATGTMRALYTRGIECRRGYVPRFSACVPCSPQTYAVPGALSCSPRSCPDSFYPPTAGAQCAPCPTTMWWNGDSAMRVCRPMQDTEPRSVVTLMSYATIRQSRFEAGDLLLCDHPLACGWRLAWPGHEDWPDMTWTSPAMWMHCAQCACEVEPYEGPLYGVYGDAYDSPFLISSERTSQNSVVTLFAPQTQQHCWVGWTATYTCKSDTHTWRRPSAEHPRGECIDFRGLKKCDPGYRPYAVYDDKVEICVHCIDGTFSTDGKACVERSVTSCPLGNYILYNTDNTAEHRCIICQTCSPPEAMVFIAANKTGCAEGAEYQPYLCITNLDSVPGLRATIIPDASGDLTLSYELCPNTGFEAIAGPLPDRCYYSTDAIPPPAAAVRCSQGYFVNFNAACLPCIESSCNPQTEIFILDPPCNTRTDVCRPKCGVNETYLHPRCIPCEYARCAPGQRWVCDINPCVAANGSAEASVDSAEESVDSTEACPLGSYPLKGDCFTCPFRPNRFFVASARTNCLTQCIAGTYPTADGKCLPCPPVAFRNAPFSSYAYALFNAAPGKRWWPKEFDPPHLPLSAHTTEEPRAGVCWPCPTGTPSPHPESIHDDPCATFSTIHPRQTNNSFIPSYYFFKNRDAASSSVARYYAGFTNYTAIATMPKVPSVRLGNRRLLTHTPRQSICPPRYYYHRYDNTCRLFQASAACPPLHPSCVASLECQCLCPVGTEPYGDGCSPCLNGTHSAHVGRAPCAI